MPSESSSCSLVVPFEDLGTVLPFHLGDNHHQHSAAFVNRVRCVFEFAFLTCKTTFTRSDHCLALPLTQPVNQSAEVRFVPAVTAGGSVKFLPAVLTFPFSLIVFVFLTETVKIR